MSGSRFVLKQVHVRGVGSSDLTRYVAKSKLDPKREGDKSRELFTHTEDALTFWEARKWLSITGGALDKQDVLHYVLSFESAQEYELLGNNDEERGRQIIAFLRRAMSKSLGEIGIEEMRWVAGIHRNTANPHIHLLLNKNAIERTTQDLVRIQKLPVPMIAHYTRTMDGWREFSYGLLINSFAEQVDARHRSRAQVLRFENSLRTVQITRQLLTPETLYTRQPTEEERLIGRWLVTEIVAARAPQSLNPNDEAEKDLATKREGKPQAYQAELAHLAALRNEVERLDHAAFVAGQPPLSAFIETEPLRAILTDPPRGLNVFTDEPHPHFEIAHQRDSSIQFKRDEWIRHREPNNSSILSKPNLKEESQIISPPFRTR